MGAMLPTGGRSGPAPVVCLAGSGEAQRILEESLEPRPHNNVRRLDKLFEAFERMIGCAFVGNRK
jgi:hypothetical protein